MPSDKKKNFEPNFYENVLKFFDRATGLAKYPKGLISQIRKVNSVYKISFPIRTS